MLNISHIIDAPPPSNVRASPMPQLGRVRVSWTLPTPPPGSSLTGYSIQYRMGDSGSYMTASDPGGSATSTIVSNLQVGTQYQVRVAAKTELGVGPNSYGTTQVTTFNGVFSGFIDMYMMHLCLISIEIITLTSYFQFHR